MSIAAAAKAALPTLIEIGVPILEQLVVPYVLRKLGVGPDVQRPEFLDITEGRESKPEKNFFYHWCGDLVNQLLFNGGVRNRDHVNRDQAGGWRPAINISLIEEAARQFGLIRRSADEVEPGDIYVVHQPFVHVGLVTKRSGDVVTTLDGNSGGAPGHVLLNTWNKSRRPIKKAWSLADYIRSSHGLPRGRDVPKPTGAPVAAKARGVLAASPISRAIVRAVVDHTPDDDEWGASLFEVRRDE